MLMMAHILLQRLINLLEFNINSCVCAGANDLIQIAYAEALYEGKVGEFGYNLAGQY